MKIVKAYPPNYDRICDVLPDVRLKPSIIFTYGDTVYVPSGVTLNDHLIAHEQVHVERQLAMGVDNWWEEYLANPRFRLEEELAAYRGQYSLLLEKYPRHIRKDILKNISKHLSGAMYGKIVDKDHARQLITGGAEL